MNEETLFPDAVPDSVPAEPAAVETESSVTETTETEFYEVTEPETSEATEAVTETLPQVIQEYIEETQPVETMETEQILMDDLVDLTAESTSVLANIILCGALMIVGVLCGIRLWR